MRVGELHQKENRWGAARSAHERAMELLRGGGDVATLSRVLSALGRCDRGLSDLVAAAGWYEQARRAATASGNALWEATTLNDQGVAAWMRGDLEAAQGYYM